MASLARPIIIIIVFSESFTKQLFSLSHLQSLVHRLNSIK